jgi:undecaprenyl-diphosphatase
MNFWHSTLYGFVQGFTEFLPISSSAHLAMLPRVMNISEPGVHFDFAMHIGTFIALLFFFRSKIILELEIIFKQKKISDFARKIIFATFVSVVFILLFKPFAEINRFSKLIAFNMIIGGLLLAYAEKIKNSQDKLNFFQSGVLGFFQAVALFPGVSRSGVTITVAKFMGLSKSAAAEFSFMASLPIMLAGILYEIKNYQQFVSAPFSFSLVLWGIVTSCFFGFIALKLFTFFIEKIPFWFYGIYRVAFGITLFFLLG